MSERTDPAGLLPRSGVGRAALMAGLWTLVGVIFALPNIGGSGSALLALLIRRCEAGRWRQMLAVSGDSGYAGSIALHRRMGFQHAGTLVSVGFKFGRWRDTLLMQRPLGAADASLPPA